MAIKIQQDFKRQHKENMTVISKLIDETTKVNSGHQLTTVIVTVATVLAILIAAKHYL